MARSLRGKTALVTGAAKRLGRAIALALAEEGVHVAAHFRASESDADSLVKACRAQGVEAWPLQADLSEPEAAGALVRAAEDLAGGLDIVVNNASVFPKDRLTDFTWASLEESLRINAFAPVEIGRAFAALGRGGDIVNLLDARMEDYDREHVSYHLSKRMLYSLTQMMAEDFAPAVRVNAVAPGLVLPPEGEDESYLDALADTNPMRGHGSASDVSEAVLYLLKSEFTTGQVLFVDGGRHLRGGLYG